ncbi:dipeptidase [Novosphingobium flavum]|uniref:Dipeptidase n=1 Tax=Novosphingobium flavum TaxID=1778672 RepID=A0A7X1KLS0_9SPHN|nr:dipeptidase [Novosphingobium flavum]MBC2665894.1 dipeptidase [Novosphingobium flavum]
MGIKVSARAMAIHQRALTLDTHLDTPASLAIPGWSIEEGHDVHTDYTQVDLPRMIKGGLDGGYWAIYTAQGPLDTAGLHKARDFALMRGMAIREMVLKDPAHFAFAYNAADAAPIARSGKRVVFMSMENAYPLGEDTSLLSTFYGMGVRLVGFAHFQNNQFADSSTDPKGEKWGGLSPLGIQLLAEMNRLGIIPDGSHSSDKVLDDLLRLSKAPAILSHSGCKAVFDHPRNIDDDHLRALAAKGGVIQINSYGAYLKNSKVSPERAAALKALFANRGEARMSKEARAEFLAKRAEIDRLYPDSDRATFEDFRAQLLHALKVVGPDHVGIGMDWDGGGGVAGLEDASQLPEITEILVEAGYSEADIDKIWSGNVLRVMAAVEAEAKREQAGG